MGVSKEGSATCPSTPPCLISYSWRSQETLRSPLSQCQGPGQAPSGCLWSPETFQGANSQSSGFSTAVWGWRQDWSHHLTRMASPHLVRVSGRGWTRVWTRKRLKPHPTVPAVAVDGAGAGKWHEDSSQQKQALEAGPASGPQCLLETHSWKGEHSTPKMCPSPLHPTERARLISPSRGPPGLLNIPPRGPVPLILLPCLSAPPPLTSGPGQGGKWRPGGWLWQQLGRVLWGSGPVGAGGAAPRGWPRRPRAEVRKNR